MANEQKVEYIQIILKEYDLVRSEITDALKRRFSIMQYGMVGVGGLLAWGASHNDPPCLRWIVIALLAPGVTWAALFVWLGEYERTQRAGAYIKHVEAKLNDCFGGMHVLGWESFLDETRSPPGRMRRFLKNRVPELYKRLFSEPHGGHMGYVEQVLAVCLFCTVCSLMATLLWLPSRHGSYLPVTLVVAMNAVLTCYSLVKLKAAHVAGHRPTELATARTRDWS